MHRKSSRARLLFALLLAALFAALGMPPARAAETASDAPAEGRALPDWVPRMLGAQFTYIGQRLQRFGAAYSGRNSLTSRGASKETDTYGMYFGARLAARLQFYLDLEMARGKAVGGAQGLGGITNGDVIRQGSINLGEAPYVARAYLRYLLPLAPLAGGTEEVERGQGHLAGREPKTRLEIKAGKFALTDDFDLNRYANTTRSQFMNWSLFNNTSWDYAADTRGYTNGIQIAWVHPSWTLRLASVQMPTFANGNWRPAASASCSATAGSPMASKRSQRPTTAPRSAATSRWDRPSSTSATRATTATAARRASSRCASTFITDRQ